MEDEMTEVQDRLRNKNKGILDRQCGSIDEEKTDELWSKSGPRYYASLVTTRYPRCKGMRLQLYLFHVEMPLEEAGKFLVLAPNRTLRDAVYPASHVGQTFSKAEIRQLHAYFKAHFAPDRFRAERADTPSNNCIGFGAYPIGGLTDFYEFAKAKDYSLTFKVWGFYDLRRAQ